MEMLEGIKTRRSIRAFTERPIEADVIKDIVESASYAPSWKNTQITRYNIITDKEKINYIAENCVLNFEFNEKTIKGCTNLVVVSHVNGRSGYERDGSFSTSKGDRWQMFDAGVATQTFCLAAWDKGVGSVILGIMDEEKIAAYIGLPENETVAALVALGYPSQIGSTPKRKDVEELLREV